MHMHIHIHIDLHIHLHIHIQIHIDVDIDLQLHIGIHLYIPERGRLLTHTCFFQRSINPKIVPSRDQGARNRHTFFDLASALSLLSLSL